jgi:hypothetical protein
MPVCLYYLNDIENAHIAFRKSVLSGDAIKNPLIYLNYSIFSLECLRNVDEAQQYLNNFYNLCETMQVPGEVCFWLYHAAADLHFNKFHLQYIQIAENVLSKLPSSTLLPETRHLAIKETKISTSEDDNTSTVLSHRQSEDEHANEEEEHDDAKSAAADDDLVWTLKSEWSEREVTEWKINKNAKEDGRASDREWEEKVDESWSVNKVIVVEGRKCAINQAEWDVQTNLLVYRGERKAHRTLFSQIIPKSVKPFSSH